MATILDIGLVQYIMPVFVFIFVWAVIFGLLSKVKLFGDNKNVNSVIAFAVAILFIIVPEGRQLINIMTPWFVIFVIIVMFIFLIFMFMGVKEESLVALATKNPALITIVISIILIIFFVAIVKVFGPIDLHTGFWGYIFNLKVLGVVFLLVIASYTVRYLASVMTK